MVSYSLCVDHILAKKKAIDFIDELGVLSCLSKPKPFMEENEVHAWLIAYILEKRVDLGCVSLVQAMD